MCGRYVSVRSDEDLTSEFNIEEVVGQPLPPSWNVAPTDDVRIIAKRKPHGHSDDPGANPVVQLRTARWGLLPNWSKTRAGGAKMINARSETVASKPAFKAAAARRRCLAPAIGYYEWQHDGGRKIPYFLHAPDESTLAMAALYEVWRDPDLPDDHPDKWIWTTTIVTRPAADAVGHIHDRCPVLVPADRFDDWLDCSSGDPDTAKRLLDDFPEPHLVPRVVSAAVSNVRNNGPELIEPAGQEPQAAPQQLTL